MFGRMVLSAALALAPAAADAVTYSYTYFTPWASIWINGYGNLEEGVAYYDGETEGYSPATASFSIAGDPSGKTFTHDGTAFRSGELAFSLPGLSSGGGSPEPGSYISFGATGSPESWFLSGFAGHALVEYEIASTPRSLGSLPISNPELALGAIIYDYFSYEGFTGVSSGWWDDFYTTRPGLWEFTVDQPIHAPIPATGLLMLGGLAGLAWLRRRHS